MLIDSASNCSAVKPTGIKSAAYQPRRRPIRSQRVCAGSLAEAQGAAVGRILKEHHRRVLIQLGSTGGNSSGMLLRTNISGRKRIQSFRCE